MSPSLKGKLIAGFIFAFLAGSATGAFFAIHQARHWRDDLGRPSHSIAERMRSRIKSHLDLTPEQMSKVDPILDHAAGELQKVRTDTGARVREVMDETNQALRPLLTDAQRTRLEKMEKDLRKNRGLRKPGGHRRLRGSSPSEEHDPGS
jgi:hypothetical protein